MTAELAGTRLWLALFAPGIIKGNIASRNAIQKIGGQFAGVLRTYFDV